MTHICIGLLTIIITGNGLSPGLHQATFGTNAEKLLIVPLRTNLSEILIKMLVWKCHLWNGGHFVLVSICKYNLAIVLLDIASRQNNKRGPYALT